MASWGPKLYQNDLAVFIKNEYKDNLHRGKAGEEITQMLIKNCEEGLSDCDDAPVFWFALADTQWELGRLENFVKEQALKHIYDGYDLKYWENESAREGKTRAKVLNELKQKLLSPQPEKKKFSQYRLYHCEWNIGDIYAIPLTCDLAKEKGLFGKYALIQKIDEMVWHPGHTIPILYVKITRNDTLPKNIKEYNTLDYIQTGTFDYNDVFFSHSNKELNYYPDEYGFLSVYRIALIKESKRSVPNDLIYVGNFLNTEPPYHEFIPHTKLDIQARHWNKFNETFEQHLVNLYCWHNLKEAPKYNKRTDT